MCSYPEDKCAKYMDLDVTGQCGSNPRSSSETRCASYLAVRNDNSESSCSGTSGTMVSLLPDNRWSLYFFFIKLQNHTLCVLSQKMYSSEVKIYAFSYLFTFLLSHKSRTCFSTSQFCYCTYLILWGKKRNVLRIYTDEESNSKEKNTRSSVRNIDEEMTFQLWHKLILTLHVLPM